MPLLDLTPFQFAFAFFALFLGGMVKGTIGMGMKIVVLGLLATIVELPVAIAIIILPAVATNIWQVFGGPPLRETLRRTWSLFVMFCVGVWFGTEILAASNPAYLAAALGVLLVVYSAYALFTPRIPYPERHEVWMSPAIGGITGIFGGMTGSDVIPGVPYMQAQGLSRDMLTQAMGILFLLGSTMIAFAFTYQGLLTAEIGVASALGSLPTLGGYYFGAKIRSRIPEAQFRKLLLSALFLLGIYIMATNLT
ncbi:MAG: sulfite exporter TauE/SafE family protein [Alphaproteobacteria bacterium]